MKLRFVETGYKSPKTVSDGGGGNMILPFANVYANGAESPQKLVKETVAVSFWEKEDRNRKAPYRAAR
jgi:hypothetical protein